MADCFNPLFAGTRRRSRIGLKNRLRADRGYLRDWLTQVWVRVTGRRVNLETDDWLSGPVAPVTGVGPEYFAAFAAKEELRLRVPNRPTGILPEFGVLKGPGIDPARVHPGIVRFYEQTSGYERDAWADWRGIFRPFGRLLAILFSRRLQQLNVPLTGLDSCRGVVSEVLQFVDPGSGDVRHTVWYRRLAGTGNTFYASFYTYCRLPGGDAPCMKVVFPLPNGNAIVILRTQVLDDGSFALISSGDRFGEPGFYFTVYGHDGECRARYVRSLQERLHVFPAEDGAVRADHVLTYFGILFLRLHYRMRCRDGGSGGSPLDTDRAANSQTTGPDWQAEVRNDRASAELQGSTRHASRPGAGFLTVLQRQKANR